MGAPEEDIHDNSLTRLVASLPLLQGLDRRQSASRVQVEGNRVIVESLGTMPATTVELQFKRDGHILGACTCQQTSPSSVCKHVNRALKEVLSRRLDGQVLGAKESPPTRFSKLFRLTKEEQTHVRQITAPPTPRLRIYLRGELAVARLGFAYEGRVIDPATAESTLFDAASQTLLRRDLLAERQLAERLTELGFEERTIDGEVALCIVNSRLPDLLTKLAAEGWHVEVNDAHYRPATSLRLRIASGIDWFEVRGDADFGGHSLPFPKLLDALAAGERTVTLDDGTVGLLPAEWSSQFAPLQEIGKSTGDAIRVEKRQIALLDALLVELPPADTDAGFAAARERLRDFERIVPRPAPAGFGGTLRPYQELAQGWFAFLREFGFGGCLADDMGLGKTIQVLALLEERRQQKAGPSLVVVPRSLVFNWISEARRFTPNLRVLDQSHATRTRSLDPIREHDLILTTYGTLRRDAEYLKDITFDYVILDESQAIKNESTDAAKAARLLKADHRLAMSGTPIENHLCELWSLMEFLNPGLLGRSSAFKRLTTSSDPDKAAVAAIARAVRPFILRRTKSQVATDLPERVEQTIQIEPDADHRAAYDELREHYRTLLADKIAKDGLAKSQMIVLEALLRLRQASCHVGLLNDAKALASSAKFDVLLEHLQQIIESGQKALVFSQFTSLLALLKPLLEREGIRFEYLDGQTRDRQAHVNRFQTDPNCPLFLVSLKAGGVGLNLTAAGYVFLLDPWWNPAAEAQAIDRAHRIGQTQAVIASRLIARDTVEERVMELQTRKRDLANAIINADRAGTSALTRDDIDLLLS